MKTGRGYVLTWFETKKELILRNRPDPHSGKESIKMSEERDSKEAEVQPCDTELDELTKISEETETQEIEAQPYDIELDEATKCPLHYLTVLAKYVLPTDLANDTNIQKIVDCGIFEGYSKAQEEEGSDFSEIAVGNLAEGLAIPDFLDTESNTWHVCSDMEKVKVVCNEYQPNPNQRESNLKLQTEQVSSVINTTQTRLKYTENYLAFKLLQGQDYPERYLSKCELLSNSGLDQGSDINIAVQFKSWPRVAIPWMTRSRAGVWPSPEVKATVIQNGYHLIPATEDGNKDCGPLWEYAFYSADKHLAHALSSDQRQVFLLFNLIQRYHFSTPSILSHDHMKAVFFWMLEKTPADCLAENNLGRMLMLLLKSLASALTSRNLEHYYIAGVNMLQSASSDECQVLLEKVKYVTDNVIDILLSLNQRLQFSGVGFKLDLQSCFSDHAVAIKDNPEDEITFCTALINGCFKLIEVLLSQMAKFFKGKLNNQQKVQFNLLNNICLQALWDIKCFSAESDDFPSDLHSAIYSLGYFSDHSSMVSRVILHLSSKAAVDKDRTVGCIEDIIHYCRGNRSLQRAMNLMEVRRTVMESESNDPKPKNDTVQSDPTMLASSTST